MDTADFEAQIKELLDSNHDDLRQTLVTIVRALHAELLYRQENSPPEKTD